MQLMLAIKKQVYKILSLANFRVEQNFKMWRLLPVLIISISSSANSDPSLNFGFSNVNDEIYQQPIDLMASGGPKTAHIKDQLENREQEIHSRVADNSWAPFDFSKFDDYLSHHTSDADHNRIKRRAKRRRGGRRRMRVRSSTKEPDEVDQKNKSSTDLPEALQNARRADTDVWASQQDSKKKRKKKKQSKSLYETYDPPIKEWESGFVEMPKDLYQAHLRPGVIFRIHMSEAIMKMQYRNYGEDKDESVIEADVEYLRLTRKVINDEITKFEDLKWLVGWYNNRSDLIQEHMCNTRYFAVGTPATMFTHSEEYMKRMCLFDNVFIDHIPYVVGEDGSLMAAVAPPVLHCDAATCTSVPFIDSVMFDERLGRTNVRTLTRCQASCRAHCRNDPDCLKRCSDRCLRND